MFALWLINCPNNKGASHSIGDVNFSDLSNQERLYSNQNKNWRLKFYKLNLDED